MKKSKTMQPFLTIILLLITNSFIRNTLADDTFCSKSWRKFTLMSNRAGAIDTNDNFYTWGSAYNGAHGLGSSFMSEVPPTIINDTSATWTDVIFRYSSSLGLKTDGTIWGTGENRYGELGVGDRNSRSRYTQATVPGPFKSIFMTSADSGYITSFAIKTEGTLWAAGYDSNKLITPTGHSSYNVFTQIGTDTDWASILNADEQSIAPGEHICALKTNKSAYCWGSNWYGQVGNGANTASSTLTLFGNASDQWTGIYIGKDFTIGLKLDGTLWGTGNNNESQLGITGQTKFNTPQLLASGKTFKFFRAGTNFALAIDSDGKLFGWGDNHYKQIGPSASPTTTPTQIGLATTWERVTVDLGDYDRTSLGLQSDGSLWSWGNNKYYQIGDGTNTDRPDPTQVGKGIKWTLAGTYEGVTAALDENKDLFMWGANYEKQAGTGGSSGNFGIPTACTDRSTNVCASKTCTACTIGFLKSGPVCIPCATNCAACTDTGSTQCLSCKAGTSTYFDSATGSCVATCPSGYYKDNDSLTCLLSLCSSSQYWDGTLCKNCDPACNECTAAGDTGCKSCAASYKKYVKGGTTQCVTTCPAKWYVSGSDCAQCNTTCATCSNGNAATDCNTCDTNSGYYKYTNGGISTCQTSCPAGWFISGTYCAQCNSACDTCSGGNAATNCLTCKANQYYKYVNGATTTCVATCPEGTFISGGDCSSCDPKCKKCSGTATNCSECANSYALQPSNSYICATGCPSGYTAINKVCIKDCIAGEYADGDSCLSCDEGCSTCTAAGPSNCIACAISPTPYYKYTNSGTSTCQTSCPAGWFISENFCISCSTLNSDCTACTDSTHCTTCSGDKNPEGPNCIQTPSKTPIIKQTTASNSLSTAQLVGIIVGVVAAVALVLPASIFALVKLANVVKYKPLQRVHKIVSKHEDVEKNLSLREPATPVQIVNYQHQDLATPI